MALDARETAYRLARITDATDAHGNPIVTYADPVEIPGGVAFDPGGTFEPRLPGHDRVVVEPTVYGNYDLEVFPGDRVTVRGITYEAVGIVRQWRSPYNGAHVGAVLSLKAVEG